MTLAELSLNELLVFGAALVVSGVFSGLLAGIFGIGGGAILVPVFYSVFGLLDVDESVRMHLSVGSSMAIIIPTALLSYNRHKARGAVDMALLKSFIIAVPVGVILASILAAYISSETLRVIFAGLMFAVAIRLLFNRETWRLKGDIPGNPWRSIAGVFIGFFSTLMGIGGGILNNSYMTLYGRSMHQAVATSSGLGVLIAIPGTIGYIWAGWGLSDLPPASTGYVNWIAAALIIPLALVFTPIGVRIAHAMQRRHLEIAFGIFALFVSARFIWTLLT